MTKNIALFIDGTWNKPAGERHPENTNVRALYKAATRGPLQSKLYLCGVGTDRWGSRTNLPRPLRNLFGGIGGLGIANRIRDAYQFLSENYDAGDRVYLFGFSRGAFAARSLAGFVDAVGLLLRDHAKLEYVEQAYALYDDDPTPGQPRLRKFLRRLTAVERPNPERGDVLRIHFIGVWDTVAALGLPGPLRVLSARHTEHHKTELPEYITHARHALALHEMRRKFEPLLWLRTHPSNPAQTLEQVWFPGAHADIGGGYREPELADVTLEWMAQEAQRLELQLDRPPRRHVVGTVPAKLHHEIRKWFLFCTPTPRAVLSDRSGLAAETRESFHMHHSACLRFLNGEAQRYRFCRPGVNEQLDSIDELSLQLHLDLSFNHGKFLVGAQLPTSHAATPVTPSVAANNWWTHVRLNHVAKARTIVESFVNAPGVPSVEACDEFIESFCLWLLCDGPTALDYVRTRVETIDNERSTLLVPDHAKLDGFEGWVSILKSIAHQIDKSLCLFPQQWRSDVIGLAAAVKQRLDHAQKGLIGMIQEAGLGHPVPRIEPISFERSQPGDDLAR